MNMSAFETQVSGTHYSKLAIQPMQYSMANKLDACQHTIIKYVTRFRDKNGRIDLEKAKHVIDMLIELEYGEKADKATTQPEESGDGWIKWSGGECPVNQLQKVDVMLRCGKFNMAEAYRFEWDCRDADTDIIAYRVVS